MHVFLVLLFKFSAHGIDNLALSWFRSYLNDRKQRCFVNGRLSSSSSTSKGVPQSSIIQGVIISGRFRQF